MSGKFRDLVKRKKSEARIREYEKNLSKNDKLKQYGGTVLLNVIETWKESRTIVLLCYHNDSGKGIIVILFNLLLLITCYVL